MSRKSYDRKNRVLFVIAGDGRDIYARPLQEVHAVPDQSKVARRRTHEGGKKRNGNPLRWRKSSSRLSNLGARAAHTVASISAPSADVPICAQNEAEYRILASPGRVWD